MVLKVIHAGGGWIWFVLQPHTPSLQTSPDPSFPVHDTESDPRWGRLDLACETRKIMGTM